MRSEYGIANGVSRKQHPLRMLICDMFASDRLDSNSGEDALTYFYGRAFPGWSGEQIKLKLDL